MVPVLILGFHSFVAEVGPGPTRLISTVGPGHATFYRFIVQSNGRSFRADTGPFLGKCRKISLGP